MTLVAYSPLCQGLLTGKYNKDNRPTGPRAALFTEGRYQSVQVRCAEVAAAALVCDKRLPGAWACVRVAARQLG